MASCATATARPEPMARTRNRRPPNRCASPIVKNSYEYSRVHLCLPLPSGFVPTLNTEDGRAADPWKFDDRCFCFRSLTEEEINKASPVANLKQDVCQYHSIRCLRRVEISGVPSCAESYFRCKEQKDADGTNKRATTLHAELCQRFMDINNMYDDAIDAVDNVETTGAFTPEDKAKKLAAMEGFKKAFAARREVACEGTANGTPVADPKTCPPGN